jgi:flagellar assembly protein FliH
VDQKMPWSRFNGEKIESVIKESDGGRVQVDESRITEFKPRTFNIDLSKSNNTYIVEKKSGSGFVMNDAVKKISGIEEIERQAEQNLINEKVQALLEDLKQKTYDEAFKLGTEQGFRSATEGRNHEINQAIDDFKSLIQSIHNMKTELIYQNEAHIMTTIFRIAEKVAYDHIEENPQLVLPVIRKAVNDSQEDENITIHISDKQIEFIENLKKISGREFDFLKNTKLEPSAQILTGGCIIETNYGVIDAQIENRVENIWTELKQALPKIKKIAG